MVADAQTGKGVWIGRIEEHGQPAWAAITVSSAGRQIDGIDALIRRKEYGAPYVEPAAAPSFAVVPAGQRTSRAAMIAGAEAFYAAMNAHDGKAARRAGRELPVAGQRPGRRRLRAAVRAARRSPRIARVRDREVLAADEARGLVVYRTFEDLPASAGAEGYPLTYQVVELFRFVDGKIERVEAFTSELPYGMKPLALRPSAARRWRRSPAFATWSCWRPTRRVGSSPTACTRTCPPWAPATR